ncbi:protein FAR1-RELATED SEQUENCE 5-like [Olea europaea var. sylvestris]|uniref:protein FAR1-RELATED SEQUENCE 5-like n=1 Tax=Olea europaea var. sylvestris TaxID=158386 RepID=UPI000C1CD5A2|nr:protein FAR1-RELATED SEQUENCE 5-like [Olea europaea var. sylvestris]
MEVLDDEVLVESDNENLMDNVIMLEDDNVGGDATIVPEVGMKFNDEKELFEFYKKYAYEVAFPVRRRNSRKCNDVVTYVALTCSREGQQRYQKGASLKPQPTIQMGCKARITASLDVRGIWRICTVDLEHNHKISLSKSRLYRCNRELSEHVKRRLEVNDMARIPLHKSYNSAVAEAGGYENMTCIEKDCRNYVEKVRRLRLGEGDAMSLLKNLFWADNRSRQAYKEFGDVVTFDTTYLTNKYDMPFAPFVGVNHHGQSILLGCGLLSNEDTDTFVWLFKTWMLCMHSKAPNEIITDQDRAMQNAIKIVFPNTRVVYDLQYVEEFERGWELMIDTYNLYDNEWLSGVEMDGERRGTTAIVMSYSTLYAEMYDELQNMLSVDPSRRAVEAYNFEEFDMFMVEIESKSNAA